jgi:hypothetical protein
VVVQDLGSPSSEGLRESAELDTGIGVGAPGQHVVQQATGDVGVVGVVGEVHVTEFLLSVNRP